MIGVFSAPVFSLAWGVGYAAAVYVNYPLFRYYPLVKRFSLRDLADASLGPAMAWYGWMATGAVFALIATTLIPKRVGDRLPAAALWIAILLMLAAGWYREREWFVAAA